MSTTADAAVVERAEEPHEDALILHGDRPSLTTTSACSPTLARAVSGSTGSPMARGRREHACPSRTSCYFGQ
jgi:hypothetical protein